jgi:hypothetical protein
MQMLNQQAMFAPMGQMGQMGQFQMMQPMQQPQIFATGEPGKFIMLNAPMMQQP